MRGAKHLVQIIDRPKASERPRRYKHPRDLHAPEREDVGYELWDRRKKTMDETAFKSRSEPLRMRPGKYIPQGIWKHNHMESSLFLMEYMELGDMTKWLQKASKEGIRFSDKSLWLLFDCCE